jgi:hypothetical protein
VSVRVRALHYFLRVLGGEGEAVVAQGAYILGS